MAVHRSNLRFLGNLRALDKVKCSVNTGEPEHPCCIPLSSSSQVANSPISHSATLELESATSRIWLVQSGLAQRVTWSMRANFKSKNILRPWSFLSFTSQLPTHILSSAFSHTTTQAWNFHCKLPLFIATKSNCQFRSRRRDGFLVADFCTFTVSSPSPLCSPLCLPNDKLNDESKHNFEQSNSYTAMGICTFLSKHLQSAALLFICFAKASANDLPECRNIPSSSSGPKYIQRFVIAYLFYFSFVRTLKGSDDHSTQQEFLELKMPCRFRLY